MDVETALTEKLFWILLHSKLDSVLDICVWADFSSEVFEDLSSNGE